ncbi:hypothetical protein BS78_03G071800 [Paspalum vaginatum]|nr:hypothetical protein BS78_03G071800 [Paspalum vaginatum]
MSTRRGPAAAPGQQIPSSVNMRPSAPLLFPLLVSLLLLLHHRALADCEPTTCGNLTVRYPFWLGTINQSSSPCGHLAFEILCSDDSSSASLKGSAIHVLDIDYSNNSFVASHTRIAAGDDGVCRTDFNMSAKHRAQRLHD